MQSQQPGLASYAVIGVPSVAMYGFDWWAYEILTLLAGGLHSQTQLAAPSPQEQFWIQAGKQNTHHLRHMSQQQVQRG